MISLPIQRGVDGARFDRRVRAGIVGEWTGSGNGTLWMDQSINNNNASLVAFATTDNQWILGREGNRGALRMAGAGRYAQATSLAALNGTANFTICVVCRKAGTGFGAIVGQSTTTSNRAILHLWNDSNVYFSVNSAYVGLPFQDTDWHHFAAVFDGSQTGNTNRAKIYIDGSERTITLQSGTIPTAVGANTAVFSMGVDTVQGLSAVGDIESVCVYERSLSSGEIAILGNPTFMPIVATPRWLAKLNAGGGGGSATSNLCLLGVG